MVSHHLLRIGRLRLHFYSLQGFKIHRNKLRSMGHEDKDMVRLHHDCDKSFEGDLKQYLIDDNIEDTNTGGQPIG